MPLDGDDGAWDGPLKKPSIRMAVPPRPDARPGPRSAPLCTPHAEFSTIPGHRAQADPGNPLYDGGLTEAWKSRAATNACYGTAALSQAILAAMGARNGCLMANHGMLTWALT